MGAVQVTVPSMTHSVFPSNVGSQVNGLVTVVVDTPLKRILWSINNMLAVWQKHGTVKKQGKRRKRGEHTDARGQTPDKPNRP